MRRWIDRARLRLRSLMRGSDVDAALQREIRQHVDEQIAENLAAGMSPRRARERPPCARSARSGASKKSAATRAGSSIVENFAKDLRYTLRSLTRQPLLVVAATMSIAVAVGANTTIFSLATELLYSRAHDPSARASSSTSGWANGSHVSYPQWQALRAERRARRARRLSVRGRGQLARTRPIAQPGPAHRHGEFLRRARRAGRDGPRVHGGRSRCRPQSERRGHQPRILAGTPRRRSRRCRADAASSTACRTR